MTTEQQPAAGGPARAQRAEEALRTIDPARQRFVVPVMQAVLQWRQRWDGHSGTGRITMPGKSKGIGGRSKSLAPGQQAKLTGLPAKSFAPGQLKKAGAVPKVKKTK